MPATHHAPGGVDEDKALAERADVGGHCLFVFVFCGFVCVCVQKKCIAVVHASRQSPKANAPDMAVKPPMELPAMKKGERMTSMAKSRTCFFFNFNFVCVCFDVCGMREAGGAGCMNGLGRNTQTHTTEPTRAHVTNDPRPPPHPAFKKTQKQTRAWSCHKYWVKVTAGFSA